MMKSLMISYADRTHRTTAAEEGATRLDAGADCHNLQQNLQQGADNSPTHDAEAVTRLVRPTLRQQLFCWAQFIAGAQGNVVSGRDEVVVGRCLVGWAHHLRVCGGSTSRAATAAGGVSVCDSCRGTLKQRDNRGEDREQHRNG